MAITPKKSPASKSVETVTHDEATRRNIPTAEYRSIMEREIAAPVTLKYPATPTWTRNWSGAARTSRTGPSWWCRRRRSTSRRRSTRRC